MARVAVERGSHHRELFEGLNKQDATWKTNANRQDQETDELLLCKPGSCETRSTMHRASIGIGRPKVNLTWDVDG